MVLNYHTVGRLQSNKILVLTSYNITRAIEGVVSIERDWHENW